MHYCPPINEILTKTPLAQAENYSSNPYIIKEQKELYSNTICKYSKSKMAFHFYTMGQKNKMIAMLYASQKHYLVGATTVALQVLARWILYPAGGVGCKPGVEIVRLR